jgi:hypothetical protein
MNVIGGFTMYPLSALAVFALSSAIASMAYALCFTVTTLGGYLPFFMLTLSPVFCFALGFATARYQKASRIEWLQEVDE